jgi:hypothetical protein
MGLRTFVQKTQKNVHLVDSAVNNTSAGSRRRFVTDYHVRNALYSFVGARSGGRLICGKCMLRKFEV